MTDSPSAAMDPDGNRNRAKVSAAKDLDAMDHEYKWTTYGVIAIAGLVGAFIVAFTFLIVDILSGRPAMWTPAVLGAALFLGEQVGTSADLQPTQRMPLVFGYTLAHGITFLGFASAASAGRISKLRRHPMTIGSAALNALLVFLGLEVFFFGMGWLLGPDLALAGRLGWGWITLANALAAIGMTATIMIFAKRLNQRLRSDITKSKS